MGVGEGLGGGVRRLAVALASERGVRWRVSRTDRREAHRLVRGLGEVRRRPTIDVCTIR